VRRRLVVAAHPAAAPAAAASAASAPAAAASAASAPAAAESENAQTKTNSNLSVNKMMYVCIFQAEAKGFYNFFKYYNPASTNGTFSPSKNN
jgi:hypothetical protein